LSVSGGGAGDTPRASTCHHFQPDSQSKCGQTVTMGTSRHINSTVVVFKAAAFITVKVKLSRPALNETAFSRNTPSFNKRGSVALAMVVQT